MWQQIYSVLTTYEGLYLCYLFPIVYFAVLVLRFIFSRKHHEHIRVKDVMAGVAVGLISFDFARYLYLLLTHTGRILPFNLLFIKYTIGFLLWIWVFWYCYQRYRQAPEKQFAKSWAVLIICWVGSLVLAFIGAALLS